MSRPGILAQDAGAGSELRLTDHASFAAAVQALEAQDPGAVGTLLAAIGQPVRRTRPADFAGLAAIVLGQQVSTASAAAMVSRLTAAVVPLEPARLLTVSDTRLRACGLSSGKMRTLRAVATAATAGALRFDRLPGMPVAEVRAALLAITGIGPWTADIFLLFGLGHADVWPAGDLALQEATRLLLGIDARPDAAGLTALGTRWRPYRGVAATLLWAYYRHRKGRPGIDATVADGLDRGAAPAGQANAAEA